MRYTLFDQHKDTLLLIARVLMMVLCMLFGWNRLVGFSGTVAYMGSLGTPVPAFAAVVAVVMELVVGIAIVLGFYTRPLAFVLGYIRWVRRLSDTISGA